MPVALPKGVQVKVNGSAVSVKGPRGEMARTFSDRMKIHVEGEQVLVERPSDEKFMRALHGTTRALINNMVQGVSAGVSKTLQIEGVGYRAEMKGKTLVLSLGFSHPVPIEPPEGISFSVDEKARTLTVSGYDKEAVGQLASDIRKIRPPEPYKGKGLRYLA